MTRLPTSKLLGGYGGGSQEVNRRAVLTSTQIGHAGLTKFCAGMNLQPPVTKTCYNEVANNLCINSISIVQSLVILGVTIGETGMREQPHTMTAIDYPRSLQLS